MTDNPTSSEGKKIVQKFVFQKSSRQAAYLPSLFSTYSQLSKERKNNFQSNFSRGFYLVPKCIEKKITVAQTLEGDLTAKHENDTLLFPGLSIVQANSVK